MTPKTGSDEIIFVGLNRTAAQEAKSLRNQGNKVTFIGPGTTQDRITRGKKTYDLNQSAEVEAFLNTLELSSTQKMNLAVALNSAGRQIKDEFGHLVAVLAKMEKTRSGPGRLVLSSHSSGSYFWGDHNGGFIIKKFKEIIASLPVAASLIEDLHLSACYSGKERYLGQWLSIFPNLSTIWAYSGSAPGAYVGSKKHLFIWNSATRGNKIKLERAIAQNTRKGNEVAVWSRYFGYQAKGSSAINDLIQRIDAAESTYQSYFSGQSIVQNTQAGPLRTYYNDLQELVGHELITPGQISRYKTRLEKTLRLMYFDKAIKKKFMAVHTRVLKGAYNALNIPMPDYAKLNRKACLDRIAEFQQAARNSQDADVGTALDLLVNGLQNLEETHIQGNWI